MTQSSNKQYTLNPFYGSSAFLAGITAMLFFQLILSVTIKDSNTLSTVFSYGSQSIFFLSALVLSFVSQKTQGNGNFLQCLGGAFYNLGITKKIGIWQILLCIVLPIFAIIAFLPVTEAVSFVFSKMGYNQTPSYADYTSSPAALVSGLFGLCLFPAFGEEFMMRGALMRGLRQKGSVFAIVISALMFGIMHGSPVQFVHQFLIGLIMAYMVYITDSLIPSMIFHFLNNAVVVLYGYTYTALGASYIIPSWVLGIMFAVGLVAVILLLLLFTKITYRRNSAYPLADLSEKNSGHKRASLRTVLGQTEYGYVPYDKTPCFILYIGIGIIAFLWIFNTVSGWVG